MEHIFSIIGTNPWSYLKKYFKYFNSLKAGTKFKIESCKENNKFRLVNKDLWNHSESSATVLRQFVQCLVSFNLFIKTEDNYLIKVHNKFEDDEFEEYLFMTLFVKTSNEKINKYRFDRLMILFQKQNINVVKAFNLKLRVKNEIITTEKILKQVGEFERRMLKKQKNIDLLNYYKNIIFERLLKGDN